MNQHLHQQHTQEKVQNLNCKKKLQKEEKKYLQHQNGYNLEEVNLVVCHTYIYIYNIFNLSKMNTGMHINPALIVLRI